MTEPPTTPASAANDPAPVERGHGDPARRHRLRRPLIGLLALAGVAGVAAGTAAITAAAHHGRAPRLSAPRLPAAGVANQRPSKLPSAEPVAAATVVGPGGRTVTCPTGAEPAIVLTAVWFTPALVDGARLTAGTYRVELRGMVQNETPQPILVQRLTVTVGGVEWHPRVRVPTVVPAQSSGDVEITGTYPSPHPGAPDIHTALSWRWQASDLQPCGSAGLVEDD